MALLMNNLTLGNGLEVQTSYARIDIISGSKETMMLTLNYYLSQQAFVDQLAYLKQETFSFDPSVADGAPNFIKQAYEYLKTLPEFADAADA